MYYFLANARQLVIETNSIRRSFFIIFNLSIQSTKLFLKLVFIIELTENICLWFIQTHKSNL